MNILNIEIKARCADHAPIRAYLESAGAHYAGLDRQIDTYFRVPEGRLKLRQGNVEQALIFYRRPDQAGPKRSDVVLHPADAATSESLRHTLTAALGVLVVVDKRRHIFFIDNVKFHLDAVEGLGSFVEIEAIDRDGSIGVDRLRAACETYMEAFAIAPEDLVEVSYSDLMLGQSPSAPQ
ncbi:MAG: class IV adenylate cyclase [Rhodothermales bacterium]